MARKKKDRNVEGLFFLNPFLVIKRKSFSKKDVNHIKGNISLNFNLFKIIIAAIVYVASFALMIYMRTETGDKQIEVYGYFSIVAQVVSMTGCAASIILLVVSLIFKRNKKWNVAVVLSRIGSIILVSTLAAQLMLSIYSDAEKGYTTAKESISASMVMIALLFVIQPSFWLDSIITISGTTIGTFAISLYCSNVFGMQAFHYYAIVCFIFPFMCYFVNNTMFYAESQHYVEIMENEKLNNEAHYDKLTQCKNRHALEDFLAENVKKWEYDQANVLVVLFDIDNFKDYNDQFSHLGGDYCLKSIADAIRKAFPTPDLDFFRYGGEEFLLFFEISEKKEAPRIIEEIREAIEDLKLESPKGAPKDVVTISLGGLLITDFEDFSFEKQMSIVDKYLYIAKSAGKNISCYNGNLLKHGKVH